MGFKWEKNGEGGSAAGGGAHVDATLQFRHQTMNDMQTEPCVITPF
jgi:hypothetical protein